LHIAARYGHYLIVKYLVENEKAQCEIENLASQTPKQFLQMVLVNEDAKIEKMVKKAKTK